MNLTLANLISGVVPSFVCYLVLFFNTSFFIFAYIFKAKNMLKQEKNRRERKKVQISFKNLIAIGAIIIISYNVIKFINPRFFKVTDYIGFMLMAEPFYILVVLFQTYFLFPCIIQGYYLHKYSEEYRDLEGKTQLEWYGEKYFNKYIKGTDREEKIS
ncbi:MAG: hypothetical protein Q4A90_00860 [Streptococcus sp.]|nr:hypothetical protein [Streptococcus sp.]